MKAIMPSRNKTNPPSVSARPTLWHCAKVDKEEEEHGDEDDDGKVTKFPP